MTLLTKLCKSILINQSSKSCVFLTKRYKSNEMKVVICGAAGNIGQPLSLLLKQSPYIDSLCLYDLRECCGLATELSYIDTPCKVSSYTQPTCTEAFKKANVVVIVVGRGNYKSSAQIKFDHHADMCKELAAYVSQYCPKALVAILTDPVDSLLPLMAKVLQEKGSFDPKKLFGIATLNVMRANTFVAETLGLEPECVSVPVIGGTVGDNIIPLLSRAQPCNEFTEDEIEKVTKAVQQAHTFLVNLRTEEGESLASAFAVARFVISLIKGLKGQTNISEYAFVRTDANTLVKFMTVPIILGPDGIQKEVDISTLTSYEQCLLDAALPTLAAAAEKAKEYLGIKKPEPCDPCIVRPECPVDWCEKNAKKNLHEF